ncbi:lipid-A-disaccharide synthase, partial [Campylobacter jejuni]|nr:lipid-A-disaccharide synthase [Campylobacter jejuni]
MKTFLVCALEPSANLHLKEVLKAYKNIKYKEIDLVG